MDVHIDPTYLLFAAFGVIGVIEWVKSITAAIKAKDGSWKWPVLSLLACAAVAAVGNKDTFTAATNFFILLAFIEILGYNVIVKLLFSSVDAIIAMVTPGAPRFSVPGEIPGLMLPGSGETISTQTKVTEAPPPPATPTASPGLMAGSVPPPPAAGGGKAPNISTDLPSPPEPAGEPSGDPAALEAAQASAAAVVKVEVPQAEPAQVVVPATTEAPASPPAP